MKTFSVVARRRVAVPLLFLLAAASAVIAGSPAWAVGSDPNCDPGNNCTGFEHGAYEVTEGAAYLDVHVSAAWCCPVGQGQIDYETSDGSALAGQDFQHTTGTLTYAGGGGGVIRIPITDDTLAEGQEHFEVRLTNFRGTFVNRGHETALVRVLDKAEEQGLASPGSAGGSNPQIRGSQTGSSTPAARPSAARAASGSKASRPQPPSTASPGPPAPVVVGSMDAHNEKGDAVLSDMERRGEDRPPLALVAGLASLLLVTACVGWKKRLGARPT